MKPFDSTLISTTPINLPNTNNIVIPTHLITIQYHTTIPQYIHTIENFTFKKYQVYPFKLIGSKSIKNDSVHSILATQNYIFTMSNKELIKYDITGIKNRISGEFFDSSISTFKKVLCIYTPESLKTYTLDTLQPIESFKCESFFFNEDIFMLSHNGILELFLYGNPLTKIKYPEIITSITCNVIISKIYAGGKSGAVYCTHLDGSSGSKMLFKIHDSQIVDIKLSFDENYLYTLDKNGVLAIFDTNNDHYLTSVQTEERRINLLYLPELKIKDEPVGIS
ncbi:hypothetical protein TCON_0841 [Astathelohania contejeani]|uniref:Uncharacterized protein n=1 Tax=Astathelohania contejeani TaxID=164912 RepID=A0ABQ7I0P4_9MICR|nr:hypothetical protein TCON_0841 [Thelohania contejeani]